ncbi:MAG: NDP-sugar synthase [Chloroflexi bacterium]|nr:NDP-sugar synthase [Chloroflexota bacterium]
MCGKQITGYTTHGGYREVKMQAVLLVGGQGTRLRPLTCNTVKAMVPVLNKPFLEHLIRYLAGHGVDDIIVTLCYLPDCIESYFGDGSSFGVKLTYVMEETPLGTAGAVRNADKYLDEVFFVFNGDIFTDLDLRAMLSFHRKRKAKVTIALTPVEDPTAYGVVEMDSRRRVKRFVEKPPRDEVTSNLINAGTYILDREAIGDIPPNTPFMFERHLFPMLLAKGVPVYGYSSDAYWIDIGTPQKYRQLQYDLLQGKGTAVACGQMRRERTDCEKGCLIHPTAIIEGPVVLGTNCSIGAGVRIQGPSVVGDGCRILDGALIDRAVLWRNVVVAKKASLSECVIGDNSSIGEGCLVDGGAVIGDNVIVTEGSRLTAAEKIGPDTTV